MLKLRDSSQEGASQLKVKQPLGTGWQKDQGEGKLAFIWVLTMCQVLHCVSSWAWRHFNCHISWAKCYKTHCYKWSCVVWGHWDAGSGSRVGPAHMLMMWTSKFLSCIRLDPVSVTGRGEKQQAAKGTKSTILENSWKAKQAISNRASYCLYHKIKMSAVQMRSRKSRHGKIIHREKARSGSPVDCLNFCSCSLLCLWDPWVDDVPPVCSPYQVTPVISAGCCRPPIWFYLPGCLLPLYILFTFARYLLNRLSFKNQSIMAHSLDPTKGLFIGQIL